MFTHTLGYPRIGSNRELKKACESYWRGLIGMDELLEAGRVLRRNNWMLQRDEGMDLIPCNDFSFYDHVLDFTVTVGALPPRYQALQDRFQGSELDLSFAMARGYQKDGPDLTAMEMTKWFDTNYHYLVPEFSSNQGFALASDPKAVREFKEARALGIDAKPVLIGPITYLLLGKEKEGGFNRVALLDRLLPVYIELLGELLRAGAECVQIDEPFLALDLGPNEKRAYALAFAAIAKGCPGLKIMLATYFGSLDDNAELAVSLPVHWLHVDLVRAPAQLDSLLSLLPPSLGLSLGLVDGRNVWKNDLVRSLEMVAVAGERIGAERIALAPSCSLLHVPCDLSNDADSAALPAEVRRWLSFARQKLGEVALLQELAQQSSHTMRAKDLKENMLDMENHRLSSFMHKPAIQRRVAAVSPDDHARRSPFALRQPKQHASLGLPLYPTTTIGSFPQTNDMRQLRLRLRKGDLTQDRYDAAIRAEIERAIRWQEEIGLDVLVHGEFERNDMVEYFGERLEGFAFTANGWVQSYGSRCVKPPILYGDVERRGPMTVHWLQYAQSLTERPVKGMLTGPVTILQWSFVRDDQPRSVTARQIALAIRDEVEDLESAGIGIIQIDEPALREGLPLRQKQWSTYLRWAVDAFKLASSGVSDDTQIHTHMCYSEFNDIIASVAEMDADVITIETSRSQMKLLEAFSNFQYPNEIGPGVYDIHSPRVADQAEMEALIRRALDVLPERSLWINPDCGLKTRGWPETRAALVNMVGAAKALRAKARPVH